MTSKDDGGRRFPIHPASVRDMPDLPSSVPWDFVAPFERNALRNHSQTLERLAARGGLAWVELEDILTGRAWNSTKGERASAQRVLEMLAARKSGGA